MASIARSLFGAGSGGGGSRGGIFNQTSGMGGASDKNIGTHFNPTRFY